MVACGSDDGDASGSGGSGQGGSGGGGSLDLGGSAGSGASGGGGSGGSAADAGLGCGKVVGVVRHRVPKLERERRAGLHRVDPRGGAGSVNLGLTAGQIHPMDFFFAERNCCASNFRLETNFEFVDCGIVK